MLEDHSIPPLVDILRGLNLDAVHEVHTWHTEDKGQGEEEAEISLFKPFSNPQGKIPLILIALAVVGTILSTASNQSCKFVTREVSARSSGEPIYNLSAGLWAYNLKQCTDEGNCGSDSWADCFVDETCSTNDEYFGCCTFYDRPLPSELESSEYCQEYGPLFERINTYWITARAFSSLAALLGVLSIGLISTATCTELRKRTWMGVSEPKYALSTVISTDISQ